VGQYASQLVIDSICFENQYVFRGDTFPGPGQYRDTISASSGCDTIYVLRILQKNSAYTFVGDSFCQGSFYVFRGDTFRQPILDTLLIPFAGGCDSIIILHLKYGTLVTPIVQQTGGLLFVSEPAGVTYQWYHWAVLIPGATDSTYVPTSTGWYYVRVTDTVNGCSNISEGTWMNISGISDINSQEAPVVYPNPSHGTLHCHIPEGQLGTRLYLYSITGSVIYEAELDKYDTEIDISNISSGMYTIKTENKGNSTQWQKLLVY
jgi:hypothetical protein